MTNYDIKSLIPQREPILLVDALVGVEGDMARTQLTVRRDNSFVGDDGLLAEQGLIGVSLLTGETCVGEETLACTQMKIYVAEGALL